MTKLAQIQEEGIHLLMGGPARTHGAVFEDNRGRSHNPEFYELQQAVRPTGKAG